jgi:uncharacterized protein YfaP (DUF2135 family)
MFISPRLTKGEVRIVLTWKEFPGDLDAHLFTPYNEQDSDTEYHVWFRNPQDSSGNRLDVDAMAGYGPETVTIADIGDGLYKYYVTDFSHCIEGNMTSTELSFSQACVQVYTETGLTQMFYVPCNREGVIWEVFEIRNKTIVPIQRYYSNISDKPWWNTDKQG